MHVLPFGDVTPAPTPRAEPRVRHVARVGDAQSGYAWTVADGSRRSRQIGLARCSHILNVGNVALALPVAGDGGGEPVRPAHRACSAGIASSLAYNFFFLPPTGTLTVSQPRECRLDLRAARRRSRDQPADRPGARLQADLAAIQRTDQFGARRLSCAGSLAMGDPVELANARDLSRISPGCSTCRRRLARCRAAGRPYRCRRRSAAPVTCSTRSTLRPRNGPERERARRRAAGSGTLTASDWLFQPLRAGLKPRPCRAGRGAGQTAAIRVRSDQLPLLVSLRRSGRAWCSSGFGSRIGYAGRRGRSATRDRLRAALAVLGQPRSAHAAHRDT